MNSSDLLPSNHLGMLESESQNPLGSLPGDQLDGLNDTVDNDVLDTGVLSLGVLTDEDSVDIIIRSLVTGDRAAGTDVGKKVEGTTKSQVERDVTLSDGGLRWG